MSNWSSIESIDSRRQWIPSFRNKWEWNGIEYVLVAQGQMKITCMGIESRIFPCHCFERTRPYGEAVVRFHIQSFNKFRLEKKENQSREMINLRSKKLLRNLVGDGNLFPAIFHEHFVVPVVVTFFFMCDSFRGSDIIRSFSTEWRRFGWSVWFHPELFRRFFVPLVLSAFIIESSAVLSFVQRSWRYYSTKWVWNWTFHKLKIKKCSPHSHNQSVRKNL